MALLRMEHTYYKHDRVANALNKAQALERAFGDRAYFHPSCIGTTEKCALDVHKCHLDL